MAQNVNDLLMAFSAELEDIDGKLLEDKSNLVKNGKLITFKTTVLVIIDGPNSLGQDYQDQLNLKKIAEHTHN